MATDVRPAPSAPASKYDSFIETQLAKAEARIRLLDLGAALLGFVAGTLAYAVLMALADRAFELSAGTRKAGFVLYLAGSAVYLYLAAVRPLRWRVNPYYAARQLESTLPGAKNSVVNWVDLHEEKLPGVIRTAVGQRAAKDLQRADLERAISSRRTAWAGGAAALAAAGFVALFLSVGPRPFASLLGRSFAPFGWSGGIDKRTHVEVVRPAGGHATITIGSPFMMVAELDGRIPEANAPDAPRMLYRSEEGEPYRERFLQADESGRQWATTLSATEVMGGFWYRVAAGDYQTEEYRVKVRAAPLITEFRAKYHFPSYLGRSDKVVWEVRKLEGVRGTSVEVWVRANRRVKEGRLDFEGADGRLLSAAGAVAGDGSALSFPLVLNQSGHYRLRFTSVEGESYADERPYDVKVIPDKKPTVKLTEPGKPVELPADARLDLKGQAEDDFGVKALTLRLRVAGGTRLAPLPYRFNGKLALEGGGYMPLVPYEESVDLSGLKGEDGKRVGLKPGDVVEYWLEAADACEPEPNVGRSERYTVTILPPRKDEQKRQQEKSEAEKRRKEREQKLDRQRREENDAREKERREEEERQKEEERKRQEKRDKEAGKNQGDKEQSKDGKGSGESKDDRSSKPDGSKDGKGKDDKRDGSEKGKENEKDRETKQKADELSRKLEEKDRERKEKEQKERAKGDKKEDKEKKPGESKGDGSSERKEGGESGNDKGEKDKDENKPGKGKDGGGKDGAGNEGKDGAGKEKGGKPGEKGAGSAKPENGSDPMKDKGAGKEGGKDGKPPSGAGEKPATAKEKNEGDKGTGGERSGEKPSGEKKGNPSKAKSGGSEGGAEKSAENKSDSGSKAGDQPRGEGRDAGADGKTSDGKPAGDKKEKPGPTPKGGAKDAGKAGESGKEERATAKDGKKGPMGGDGATGKDKPAPEKGAGAEGAKGSAKGEGSKGGDRSGKPGGKPEEAKKSDVDQLAKDLRGTDRKTREQAERRLEQIKEKARDPKAREAAGEALDKKPMEPKELAKGKPSESGKGSGTPQDKKEKSPAQAKDGKGGGESGSSAGKPAGGDQKGSAGGAKGSGGGGKGADQKKQELSEQMKKKFEDLARDLKGEDGKAREGAKEELAKMEKKGGAGGGKPDGSKPSEEEVKKKVDDLARRLGSKDAGERKQAEQELKEMEKRARDAALRDLEKKAEDARAGRPKGARDEEQQGTAGDTPGVSGGERRGPAGGGGDTQPARPEKPASHRASMMQLERFKKLVDKDVLKDAKMSPEDFKKFLKDYEELAKRQEKDTATVKDDVVAPKREGGGGVIGGRKVKPTGSDRPDLRSEGKGKPPPGYDEPVKEFIKRRTQGADKDK